ncbi:MAG: hypothetical protein AAFR03_03160 [Pseudomonadota bacterium]
MPREQASKRRPSRRKTARPAAPVREVSGEIGAIGAKGDGLLGIDGDLYHVPYTVPGDRGAFLVSEGRGEIKSLSARGPVLAEPICAHYRVCGGCQLQHVSEDFYRAWKRERIVEALGRAGLGHVMVLPVVTTPAATRRRARFSFRRHGKELRLGFKKRNAHEIVSLSECHVLHAEIDMIRPALTELIDRLGLAVGDVAVTKCANGLDVSVNDKAKVKAEPDPLVVAELGHWMRAQNCLRLALNGEVLLQLSVPVIHLQGIDIPVPVEGFLQASTEGEAVLIQEVIDTLEGARRVGDLFSGIGTFALPLARSRTVAAWDSDAAAIEALAKAGAAARRGGLVRYDISAEPRNLFTRPIMAAELNKFDGLVIDPPRAGAKEQAAEIAKSYVPRVAFVSCNPSTFARDAKILVDGGYQLTQVTPVDQFVYSAHVELVGRFERA